ncbi:MAG: transposase [Holosporaceae bacterium]|jgi:hypothetical protein|nr:transposase [Holosporaceae bacterium]
MFRPACSNTLFLRVFIPTLALQFLEDLGDRELERYLSENTAAKWFCDFKLTERTPDYSLFSITAINTRKSTVHCCPASMRRQIIFRNQLKLDL